jgi:hypothetical protein
MAACLSRTFRVVPGSLTAQPCTANERALFNLACHERRRSPESSAWVDGWYLHPNNPASGALPMHGPWALP